MAPFLAYLVNCFVSELVFIASLPGTDGFSHSLLGEVSHDILSTRQAISFTTAPCYDECNAALVSVELSGKTQGLCDVNSVFQFLLGNCESCCLRLDQSL